MAELAVKAAKATIVTEKALMAARVAAKKVVEEAAQALFVELVEEGVVAVKIAKASQEAAEWVLEAYLKILRMELEAAEKAGRASYDAFRSAAKWLVDLPGKISSDIESKAEKYYAGFLNSIGYPGF